MASQKIKPLRLGKSLLLVLPPAVTMYATFHFGIPRFLESTGYPFFVGYLIWWEGFMLLFFFASLVAYRLEGNEISLKAFAARYRLRTMDRTDWLWTAGLLAVHIAFMLGGTSLIADWASSVPAFAVPECFPPELRPTVTQELVPGVFMGMPLKGKWWIVAAYFIGWVINILGEEFWWRGYMLPRQELAHGRYTWLVHGVLWAAHHLFQKWTLPILLPNALVYAYVSQKRKNTWIPTIVHGIGNFIPLVVITIGVAG